jgi:hypothetical protein
MNEMFIQQEKKQVIKKEYKNNELNKICDKIKSYLEQQIKKNHLFYIEKKKKKKKIILK